MATPADLIAYIAARRIDERERVRARIFHHQLWVDAADPPGLTKLAYMRAYYGHFGGYFTGQHAGVPVPIIDPLDLADRITAADILTPALGDELSCWFIVNNHFPCAPPRWYGTYWPLVQTYGVALFLEERQKEWELSPPLPISGIREKYKPYHCLPLPFPHEI